jgi:predicted transcriptional regulator
MAINQLDMDDLDKRDYDILEVLAEGRANPKLIRDETNLSKGDVNTVLVRLGRTGLVRQVTRGLYEITDDGREEVGTDSIRDDLERALEHREWSAVEDALARLEGSDV